jgi:hypothetical protein
MTADISAHAPAGRITSATERRKGPDKILIERRSEVRVVADQPVRVTTLGEDRHEMQGKAVDLSCHGMRIEVPNRVAPGDPVKIELDDAIVFGEICYCCPNGRRFMVGVQLDQALQGLAELARLKQALLGGEPESREARSDRRLRILP